MYGALINLKEIWENFVCNKLDLPLMRLMVTIGNDVVDRYLFQRRDNNTVIGTRFGT